VASTVVLSSIELGSYKDFKEIREERKCKEKMSDKLLQVTFKRRSNKAALHIEHKSRLNSGE
jgi:hypothetical protein